MKKQILLLCAFACFLQPFFLNAQCPNSLSGFSLLGELDDSKYFISNETANWPTAQSNAQANGGNLVAINSAAENEFLRSNITEIVLIGFSDAATEGTFAWANGDAFTYNNFSDTNTADDDFGKMNFWNGGWGLDNQFVARKYIVEFACGGGGSSINVDCQANYNIQLTGGNTSTILNYASLISATTDCPTSSNISFTAVSGSSPDGTTLLAGSYNLSVVIEDGCDNSKFCSFNLNVLPDDTGGGVCPNDFAGFTTIGEFGSSKYYISNDVARPADAQVAASANGGYLVVISSAAENAFVQAGADGLTYIGLNDFTTEGNLQWVNGEALTYNNVNPCGFCNANSDDQDFAVIQPWDGGWSFSNFFNQRKYIMEVPCGTNPTDECSFDVTISTPTERQLRELKETSEGYQLVDLFTTISPPLRTATEYTVSKSNGNLLGSSTVQSNVDLTSSFRQYWDRTTNTVYRAKELDDDVMELSAIDAANNVIWTKIIPDAFSPESIRAFDDEIIIGGNSQGTPNIPVLKTDLNGNLIWKKSLAVDAEFGSTGRVYGESVTGGYYLNYYNSGPFVIKLDNDGNIDWVANNGTSDPPSERRTIIGESPDGQSFYFLRNSFNTFKGILTRFDVATGTATWGLTLGEAMDSNPPDYRSFVRNTIPTNDGGIVVFYTYSAGFNPINPTNSFHERYDVAGNLMWSRSTPDYIAALSAGFLGIAANDGGFILGDSDDDFRIIRMTSDGFFTPDCDSSGDLPDLTVSNITNLPTSGMSGDVIFYDFTLNNIGAAVANGTYNVNTYISTDNTFSTDDVLAGEVPTGDTPIGSLDVPAAITVPALPDGDYFLIVVADSNNEITESDETNNSAAVGFTIGGATEPFCGFINSYPISNVGDFRGFSVKQDGAELKLTTIIEQAPSVVNNFQFETTTIGSLGQINGTFSEALPGSNRSNFNEYVYTFEQTAPKEFTVSTLDALGASAWTTNISLTTTDPDVAELNSFQIQELDDHILIAGVYRFGGAGRWRTFLVKLDLNGNEIWQSFLDETTFIPQLDIYEQAADGGAYIGEFDNDTRSVDLIKTNASGSLAWSADMAGDLVSNRVRFGGESPDGSSVFFGVGSISNARADITKLNSSTGAELWRKELRDEFLTGSSGSVIGNIITGIIPTNDGGVVATASFRDFSNGGATIRRYGRLDAAGNGVWAYDPPAGLEQAAPVLATSDGNFVFGQKDIGNSVTLFRINGDGFFDPLCNPTGGCPSTLAGFDYLGEQNGSAYFLSQTVARPTDAQATAEANGGYLAVISSQVENDFIFDEIDELVYIGLDDAATEGTLQWVNGESVSYTNFNVCGFCTPNSADQDFVIMHSWDGAWSWSNFFNQRKYVVEIPCGSSIDAPSINENAFISASQNGTNQEQLTLENIHPNPAEDFIQINFDSPVEQVVEIQIFDARALLQKTERLSLYQGKNTNRLSIADLPNGVYSIFVSWAEGKVKTQRFVKMTN